MLISIILSARNRASSLSQALQSPKHVAVPDECSCELLVVDNSSTDLTPAVITEAKLPNMVVCPLYEPRIGQSCARNVGVLESRGELIVSTDDDLLYTADWLDKMVGPVRRGGAEEVTGVMHIAPHLERDWMLPPHRTLLAVPSTDSQAATELIGTNMAIHRQVLERVPGFDPELGPGQLGFGEDTLFGAQLRQAGQRTARVPLDAEHHFLPERLTRVNFLSHPKKLRRSAAYTTHHWEHESLKMTRVNFTRKIAQLAVWRAAHPAEVRNSEGMHPREIHHLRSLHLYGQALIERRRPRNYERYGLVKKLGILSTY